MCGTAGLQGERTGEESFILFFIVRGHKPQLSKVGKTGTSLLVSLEVDVSEAGKMGKRNDLSDFDKGQTVMRRLGQSFSRAAGLRGVPGKRWLVEGSWAPKAP